MCQFRFQVFNNDWTFNGICYEKKFREIVSKDLSPIESQIVEHLHYVR